MAIALAGNSTLTNTNSSTATVSCGNRTVAAGSLLVAVMSGFRVGAFTVSSCSDGVNTWSSPLVATCSPSIAFGRLAVSYAMNVAAGSTTPAFTLATSASTQANAGFMEFTGAATSSAIDVSDSDSEISTAGGTDISTGPITTTDAGDVIIAAGLAASISDSNVNFGSPASFTNVYRQNDSINPGTAPSIDVAYWIPGSIQTSLSPAWTHDNNASDEGCALVISFKPFAVAVIHGQRVIGGGGMRVIS